MNVYCSNCEVVSPLHLHHVVPRVVGGTNNPGNLVYLCEGCHGLVHDHRFVGLSELIRKGLADAKAAGKRLGPPVKLTPDACAEIQQLRRAGMPFKQIAEQVGLSVGAVHKAVKKAAT